MFVFVLSLFFMTSDAVLDIGAPGYTCDSSLMKRSPTPPTTAHAVRPADIDVVMALGDSLTAGHCADDVNGCQNDYRGVSFGGGGARGLDNHITIANIIQKYNSNVTGGGANGTGPWNDYPVAHLNMGISGNRARDLQYQAQNLLSTLKQHPEIDVNNTWKLLNIFIGYNDFCNCDASGCYCTDQMCHLEQINMAADQICGGHRCAACDKFTQDQLSSAMVQYQMAEKALETSGEFDTTDDFTLVVNPWYTNATLPYWPNGTINREWYAADCYHYSSYGHALLSSWAWKNLMEPVGSKTINANLSIPTLPLACPDANCPFIRTTKNSVNCAKYGGTCISDGASCTTGAGCCSGLCFNNVCS